MQGNQAKSLFHEETAVYAVTLAVFRLASRPQLGRPKSQRSGVKTIKPSCLPDLSAPPHASSLERPRWKPRHIRIIDNPSEPAPRRAGRHRRRGLAL